MSESLLGQIEAFLRRALKARRNDGGARVLLLEKEPVSGLEQDMMVINVPPGLVKTHGGLSHVSMALLSHCQSYGQVHNTFVIKILGEDVEHVFQIRRAA